MKRKLYLLTVPSMMLIPVGFTVLFAHAQSDVDSQITPLSEITNIVIAKSNTSNGSNGLDGEDGSNGLDGADGVSANVVGDASASVKVVNVIDGTEVPVTTIDTTVLPLVNSLEEKQALDSNSLRNTVSMETVSSKADDDAEDSVALENQAIKESDQQQLVSHEPVVSVGGVVMALLTSVVNFFNNLFNLI